MKHAVIEAGGEAHRRPASKPFWQRRSRRRQAVPAHSAAATHFAEACAAIGGTTMLHDLMPDVVTVSFGERTRAVSERLHACGWSFVGTGEWQGERVLGVSFAGDRRARRTSAELVEALVRIVGELDIAENRLW
jgi:hypothetical protein